MLSVGLQVMVLGHQRGMELRNQEEGRSKLPGVSENWKATEATNAKPRPSSTGDGKSLYLGN